MRRIKINNIFFDFDGVILDSFNCKTEAFASMYRKYGHDIEQSVIKYHLENGGVSRFKKIKYWHKNYLNIDLDKKKLEHLADDFSKRVFQNVIDSDKIPGSFNFLKKYHNKFNFWIITGTPTKEINIICKKLNISHYFKGIHGSPKSKYFWTEFLISKYNLVRDEILFIGDASTDYIAAKKSRNHFALRMADYNESYFKDIDVFKFNNFDNLNKLIDEI